MTGRMWSAEAGPREGRGGRWEHAGRPAAGGRQSARPGGRTGAARAGRTRGGLAGAVVGWGLGGVL
jgi:hypothetical protein